MVKSQHSIAKLIGLNTGLSILYLVFAQLGQLLVLSPDNISLFGPATGLALCATLFFGYPLWPGIWLGALLNYALIALPVAGGEQWLSFAGIAAAVATIATLQAVIATYLINRSVDIQTGLIHYADIIRVIVYGGPVGSLIGATLGSLTMLLAGRINGSQVFIDWLSWWLSDSLVTMVILPLLFIFIAHPRKLWKSRTVSVALPVLTALIVTLATYSFISKQQQQHIQAEFRDKAYRLSDALEKKLLKNIEVLYSVQNLFNTGGRIQREHFDSFVQRALERNPGIQALGWNPVVLRHQRKAFEQGAKSEGFANFEIKERNSAGQLISAGDRERHVVVHYIVPMKGNEKAFGFDVYSHPSRRKALDMASQSGELVATSAIRLVQETGAQAGMLFMLPVYNGPARPSYNQRKQQVRGFTVGVYRLGDLMKEALYGLNLKNIQVSLIDVSDTLSEDPLVYYGFDESGAGQLLAGATGSMTSSQLAWQATFKFGQRDWQFKVYETPQYLLDNRAWTSWFVLAIGLLFSAFIGIFVLIITGRNLIDMATMDSLAKEINKRKQVENELHQVNRELEKLATTDALTHIHNRRSIENIGQMLEAEARRYHMHYSVFMLDIDHFKSVNDRFGHKIGDQVLQTLSEKIQLQLRDSDHFGRWGGEEFVIIAHHIETRESEEFANRIVTNIASQEIDPIGHITISLGVASVQPGESFDELLDRADQALYRAKQAGRNRVEVNEPASKRETATMITLKPR